MKNISQYILVFFLIFSVTLISITTSCKKEDPPVRIDEPIKEEPIKEEPDPVAVIPALSATDNIDFEAATLSISISGFDGGAATVTANPDTTGNASAKAFQLTKNDGMPWAGAFITLASPVDLSVNKGIRLKAYSPKAGVKILLKLENATDSSIAIEKTLNFVATDTWETFDFNFSDIDTSQEYHKVIFIFDIDNKGTGENYYVDDIETYEITEVFTYGALPLGFENSEYQYRFDDSNGGVADGGAFGGAQIAIASNTLVTPTNNSANVLSFSKPTGSETWAGAFIRLTDDIDFSSNTNISLDFYSSSLVSVTLYLEERGASGPDGQIKAIEIGNTTTTWQTLTFDFTGIDTTKKYNKIGFQINEGTKGDNEKGYFDNIKKD